MPEPQPRLARELKATLRLALPLVLGQLSAIGMNVVDTLLAGHLDAHTLGAVAVGASIWTLAIVAAIGVMLALPPSVAQLNGAGRRDEIGALFRQALWLAWGLGLGLLLAVYFLGPLLIDLIGVDPALVPDVRRFLHAIAFGAPALAVFFALRGLSEGLGLTRPTMYFSLLGLALLGPLGYVLMYGRLGVPRLGALGSGIATACVLWIEMAAFAVYLGCRRHYRDLRLTATFERPDPRLIGELLHIGLPMGVSVFMEASLFVAVALAIGRLGADVVASHQIALNVASVAFMVPLGLAMATTVRVGHAAGRGDAGGVRYAGFGGMLLTLVTQGISAGLMFLLPGRIAALYSDDPVVIALAAQLLVLAGMFQFSDGIQVAANGALRGLKDTRVPMLVTTFAYWGVGMTVGWWLAFDRDLGARGMWMGLIAGLSAAAILLLARFWRLARTGAATAAVAQP
ncbi:MAG TPA: MATE family efflux transporter [Rhodanobacteraceae bacterium]|nr:MATE family efflux transporter [Rhodanobacteraceae bacterium]